MQEDNKAEFEKEKSSYSASNPLELTIPDKATITVNSEDKTYTEDITKLGVFQQSLIPQHYNLTLFISS